MPLEEEKEGEKRFPAAIPENSCPKIRVDFC